MRPLFIADHPAIDFLNTALAPNGESIETIADGAAYLKWLVDARLLDRPVAEALAHRSGTKALEAAAAEARKVREWVSRWRADPRRDYREELAVLNRLLARYTCRRQVIAAGGKLQTIEEAQIDGADSLIALVAMQFAALITEEEPSLIKSCSGSGCTLWFLDRSKAHGRRYCSPTVCGNRAKVAAFRKRQRADV